jgi:transposase
MATDFTTQESRNRLAKAKDIMSHREEIEKLDDHTWSVPSQSGFGRYCVQITGMEARCTCKDFSKREESCKHIFACMALFRGIDYTDSANPRPRKTYRQNWPAYDRGQTEEMRLVDSLLKDIVSEVPDLPRAPSLPGPAPLPLREELMLAILKVYSGMSARRAVGVHRNVADRGLLTHVPSFMVTSRTLNKAELTPILYNLLQQSALPLAGLEENGVVAPDSTGIQTTSFGGWREEKHGEKREKRWLKCHAIVGTKTHIVINAVVGESTGSDSPQFGPLLLGALNAGFHPDMVVADKGYLSKANYTLASELELGAYIPFKSNSNGRARGSGAWKKAFHLFQANREVFDQNYHKRSNVESVFSALKRKFGENIRSKNPVAQVNEVLCKLIAYNLTVVVHEMFENGIAPNFVKHDADA